MDTHNTELPTGKIEIVALLHVNLFVPEQSLHIKKSYYNYEICVYLTNRNPRKIIISTKKIRSRVSSQEGDQ